MTKAEQGAITGADPTAPGGMSQQALADELVERHGWTKQQVRSAFASTRGWALTEWTDMIAAVVEERMAREREQHSTGTGIEVTDSFGTQEVEYEMDPVAEIESLISEFEEAAQYADLPEEQVGPLQHLFLPDPKTADYIFDGHMGIGPSSAERWLTCTASPAAIKRFLETLTPNQQAEFAKSTMAARQGTTAHAAAEVEANVLLGRMSTEDGEAELIALMRGPEEGEQLDDEMAEYITEYTDLIRSYAATRGAENVLIEQVVEATIPLQTVDADGEPNLHTIRGSLDCGVLPTKADPVLIVDDLKYGNGIDVDVTENPQIRIYALGLLELLTDDEGRLPKWLKKIVYHIIQPRLGGIKEYSESVDDLLDWRDEVLSPALTEAQGGLRAGAKFEPSEVACQFCPVRGSCPALAAQRMEAATELFDVIVESEYEEGPGTFPETATMDDETLGKLYAQVLGLVSIKDDLKAEAQRRLYRGQHVPGFGLVNYQPPRKWVEGADEALAEMPVLWTEKLVTPTTAEKLLGEDYADIAEYVEKPERRPVVAPEGDRRSKWEGRPPEAMFDIESEEQ